MSARTVSERGGGRPLLIEIGEAVPDSFHPAADRGDLWLELDQQLLDAGEPALVGEADDVALGEAPTIPHLAAKWDTSRRSYR